MEHSKRIHVEIDASYSEYKDLIGFYEATEIDPLSFRRDSICFTKVDGGFDIDRQLKFRKNYDHVVMGENPILLFGFKWESGEIAVKAQFTLFDENQLKKNNSADEKLPQYGNHSAVSASHLGEVTSEESALFSKTEDRSTHNIREYENELSPPPSISAKPFAVVAHDVDEQFVISLSSSSPHPSPHTEYKDQSSGLDPHSTDLPTEQIHPSLEGGEDPTIEAPSSTDLPIEQSLEGGEDQTIEALAGVSSSFGAEESSEKVHPPIDNSQEDGSALLFHPVSEEMDIVSDIIPSLPDEDDKELICARTVTDAMDVDFQSTSIEMRVAEPYLFHEHIDASGQSVMYVPEEMDVFLEGVEYTRKLELFLNKSAYIALRTNIEIFRARDSQATKALREKESQLKAREELYQTQALKLREAENQLRQLGTKLQSRETTIAEQRKKISQLESSLSYEKKEREADIAYHEQKFRDQNAAIEKLRKESSFKESEVGDLKRMTVITHVLRDPVSQDIVCDFPSGHVIQREHGDISRKWKTFFDDLIADLEDIDVDEPAFKDDVFLVGSFPSILREIYDTAYRAVLAVIHEKERVLAEHFGVRSWREEGHARSFMLSTLQREEFRRLLDAAESLTIDSMSKSLQSFERLLNALKTQGESLTDDCPYSVMSIYRFFVRLVLMCALSDPPCELYPLPGDGISTVAGTAGPPTTPINRAPKSGSPQLIALFPALYFLDTHGRRNDAPMPGLSIYLSPKQILEAEELATKRAAQVSVVSDPDDGVRISVEIEPLSSATDCVDSNKVEKAEKFEECGQNDLTVVAESWTVETPFPTAHFVDPLLNRPPPPAHFVDPLLNRPPPPSRASSIEDTYQAVPKPNQVTAALPTVRAPPLKCGMNNLGNTCYFNTTVQCLAHLPPFFNLIMQLHTEQERPSPLASSLKQVLWGMAYEGRVNRRNLTGLFHLMGNFNPLFSSPLYQRDAFTLLRTIVQELHKELNPVTQKGLRDSARYVGKDPQVLFETGLQAWKDSLLRDNGPIVETMYCQRKTTQRCKRCDHTVHSFDIINMLTLPLPDPAHAAQLEKEYLQQRTPYSNPLRGIDAENNDDVLGGERRNGGSQDLDRDDEGEGENLPDAEKVHVIVQSLQAKPMLCHLEMTLKPDMMLQELKMQLINELIRIDQLPEANEYDFRAQSIHYHFSALETKRPQRHKDIHFLALSCSANATGEATFDEMLSIRLSDVLGCGNEASGTLFKHHILVASQLTYPANTNGMELRGSYVDVSLAWYNNDARNTFCPEPSAFPFRLSFPYHPSQSSIESEIRNLLNRLDLESGMIGKFVSLFFGDTGIDTSFDVRFTNLDFDLTSSTSSRAFIVMHRSAGAPENDPRFLALCSAYNHNSISRIKLGDLLLRAEHSSTVVNTLRPTPGSTSGLSYAGVTAGRPSNAQNSGAKGKGKGGKKKGKKGAGAAHVNQAVSLQQCFAAYSTPKPLLGEKCCDSCGQKNCLETSYDLWQAGPVLIMNLVRFEQVPAGLRKIYHQCHFPVQGLDLNVITRGCASGIYDLYAVAEHRGTCDHGHYVARCRVTDDQWFLFNDDDVTRANPDSIVPSDAYVLYYVRR